MAIANAFDVVIVGAGAAGCVLARRIADATKGSVLLLEAGPDLGSDLPAVLRDGWNNPTGAEFPTDWGYASEPDAAGATAPVRRGRLVGGTSWLTRFAVRGAAADFDAWAARGNPGWGYECVVPAFRRLEADTEFGDGEWHGTAGPMPINRYPTLPRSEIHVAAIEACQRAGFPVVHDHNAPDAVGVGPMPMSTRDGVRVTTLDAYLPVGRPPANLAIRPDAHVATVTIRGGRALGVRLVDGTAIKGGLVVLSCGTYGSPTLLLRSGVGPADELRGLGIEVVIDLPGVGRHLADHPGVDLDTGWRGEPMGPGPVLHSIATLRSSLQPADGPPDLMFWIIDPTGAEPGFFLDPILLKSESRGMVQLRSADPTDPPRIALPGLREGRDIERLAEGYRLGIELANDPAIRRVARDAAPSMPAAADLPERVLANAYSIPHVVGTCRMGPSPGDGDVVDAAGRVHGIEGLAVVDASIMPDAPAGFPHIVTIMLAEHLVGGLAEAASR